VKRVKDKSKKAPDDLKAQLKTFLHVSQYSARCVIVYIIVDGFLGMYSFKV